MQNLLVLLIQTLMFAAFVFNGGWYPQEQVILLFMGSLLFGVLGLGAASNKLSGPRAPFSTIILFCGLVGLYWLFSPAPFLVRRDLALIVLYAGVALATAAVFQGPSKPQRLIGVLLGLAIANAIIGLLQEAWHSQVIPTLHGWVRCSVPGRRNGVFLNPNYLGVFSATAIPIVLWHSMQNAATKRTKVFGWLALVILACSIVVSGSRGAMVACWIGICFSGAVLLYGKVHWKRITCMVMVVASFQACCLRWNGNVVERTRDIAKTTVNSQGNLYAGESQRVGYWKGSLRLWLSNPITGIGPGLLDSRWPEVQEERNQTFPYRCHNLWIQLLCEYGIAGLGLVLYGLAVVGQRCIRNAWSAPLQKETGYAVAILVMLIYESFDYSLYDPSHGLAAAVLFGAICARRDDRGLSKEVIVTFCSCCVGFLLFHAIKQQGCFYYQRLEQKMTDGASIYACRAGAFHWDRGAEHLHVAAADMLMTAALEHEKTKPGTGNFRLPLIVYEHALNCNPFSIPVTFMIAECTWHADPALGDKRAKEAQARAPHSALMASCAASYYTRTGREEEGQQWRNTKNKWMQGVQGFETRR
jgi:O-Antigen ligase